jgi:hypothetical protein
VSISRKDKIFNNPTVDVAKFLPRHRHFNYIVSGAILSPTVATTLFSFRPVVGGVGWFCFVVLRYLGSFVFCWVAIYLSFVDEGGRCSEAVGSVDAVMDENINIIVTYPIVDRSSTCTFVYPSLAFKRINSNAIPLYSSILSNAMLD